VQIDLNETRPRNAWNAAFFNVRGFFLIKT
jgi:hypothetical protein